MNLVHTSLLFVYGVSVTLNFREGEIEIQNDAVDKPTSYREADLENLAYINSGQLSPIKAMFTGELKSRGNPLTPLKISRITVLK
ncbi:MAG: SCP2 sterol-binding domain-containing protein [Dehalococcoidia bacterium]|nr:SCP2 sterol-binding domain-containing protein [Dehalococcoidia bacterium]